MEAAPIDHAAALIACSRGDHAAFHRLYEHEAPRMLALCQHLLPEDAEDLLHDTFVLLWRNADQYDASMGAARPWIYSVLRHVANSRRLRRNNPVPVSPPALPSPTHVGGRLAQLAQGDSALSYEAVAHAYLHGADYNRLSAWLRRDPNEIRASVRKDLEKLSS